MQRDEDAGSDREQAEADPGQDQRVEVAPAQALAGALHARQFVDQRAKQHRLGEGRRCEQHVGERQDQAEPLLGAKLAQDTSVDRK
jgi:hypothetical protein